MINFINRALMQAGNDNEGDTLFLLKAITNETIFNSSLPEGSDPTQDVSTTADITCSNITLKDFTQSGNYCYEINKEENTVRLKNKQTNQYLMFNTSGTKFGYIYDQEFDDSPFNQTGDTYYLTHISTDGADEYLFTNLKKIDKQENCYIVTDISSGCPEIQRNYEGRTSGSSGTTESTGEKCPYSKTGGGHIWGDLYNGAQAIPCNECSNGIIWERHYYCLNAGCTENKVVTVAGCTNPDCPSNKR